MLYRTRVLGIAAAAALSAAVPASAQIGGPTKVRVVAKNAKIMATTAMSSDVIDEVAQGTEIDVLLEDDGWYWVVLPRDGYGTRRGGWVRVKDVDGTTDAELAAKAAQAEAKKAARDAKKQALADKRATAAAERAAKAEQQQATKSDSAADDKRLTKAQQDLEKARADYQATLQRRSDTPPTPEAKVAVTTSKDADKREARASKKQAEADKRAARAEQKAAMKEAERAAKADQQAGRVEAQRATHADANSGSGADDKRLQKAQKDLEKARADYEAALKRRSDESTTPAASPQR